jgi:hypothetical protein
VIAQQCPLCGEPTRRIEACAITDETPRIFSRGGIKYAQRRANIVIRLQCLAGCNITLEREYAPVALIDSVVASMQGQHNGTQ